MICLKKLFLSGFLFCSFLVAMELSDIELYGTGIQTDDKIVVCGAVTITGITQVLVARYNTDGSLDNTFGSGGMVTTPVNSFAESRNLVIQPDGKIVVCGSTFNATSEFLVIRYLSDGTLDTSFNSTGIATFLIGSSDAAKDIALQSDDSIVVTGSSLNSNLSDFLTIRLINDGIDDGTLDATYGTGGAVTTSISTNDIPFAVSIQTNGRAVIGGQTNHNGLLQFAVARYTTAGVLDVTFNTTGIVITPIGTNATIKDLAIQSTGEIVTGGSSDGNFALARYTSAGALDGTFGAGGIVTTNISGINDQINGIIIQPTGEIVGAGYYNNDSQMGFALARYTSAGALDGTFGTGGIVIDKTKSPAQAQDLLLQPDGDLIPIGFSDCGALLIRYLTNGTIDTTFGMNGFVVEPQNKSGCFQVCTCKSEIENIETQIDQLETCCDSLQSQIDLLESSLTFNAFTMWKNDPPGGIITFDPDAPLPFVPYMAPAGSPPISTIVSWSLAPSAGDPTILDPINISFEVPQDFDPSVDPVIDILILVKDLGGIPSPGPIRLRINFDFKSPGVSAIGPGFVGTLDSADITVTEPTPGTLTYIRHTFSLSGIPIAPQDWGYLSLHRIEPTSPPEYSEDAFLAVVSFRYNKL